MKKAYAKEFSRKKYEILRSQLVNERQSFMTFWQDLGDYIRPRRLRINVQDANKGDRRNQKIIDPTATLASRTLRSGMMSGVTSPARPWFRLTTTDQSLADYGPVKEWLHIATQRMSTVFNQSNLYNILPIIYGDMADFGTSAMFVEEDFDNTIHCHSFAIGSYCIAKDHRGVVNVFFREFKMTVRQILEMFGKKLPSGEYDWSNLSQNVRNCYQEDLLETWVDICHVIKPNELYNPNKIESKYKKFASCYYESGSSSTDLSYVTEDEDKVLSEKGYDYFPVLCPRWEVTGEDVYGTSCPGMESLGDNKGLQIMQKRMAQAIEKKVNPPMVGPSSLRSVKTSILPGDITYSDEREGQKGFRPAHEVDFSIQEVLLSIQESQMRIKRTYFEDLILAMSQRVTGDRTAREVEEIHDEKLLVFGPVLEQLNQDLLNPLIDITFDIMMRQQQLPEPPEELQGMKLKIDYLSVMAQAQKLVGVSNLERFMTFAGNLVPIFPEVKNKINSQQWIDIYGDAQSIPPGVVRSDEDTAEIEMQQQQALQAQQMAQMMEQGASAARNLSQADMSTDNALTRVLGGASQ